MEIVKVCNNCKVEKPLSLFGTNGQYADGFRSYCKECDNLKARERHKARVHLPCVYYIPEHHYIGVSKDVTARMVRHGCDGRITEGYEILAYFERVVDAMWFEAMLHQRGYNGCNFK